MSGDGEPGPRANSRLGYLLKHAEMRMTALNTAALAPLGVDGRELGILLVLADHEPQSQQQAAHRLGIDRTTMVAMVDMLESKGLVSRHPHTTDRRRNVVELTRIGGDTLRAAVQASDEAERALLAQLDPATATKLRAALQRIVSGPHHTTASDT